MDRVLGWYADPEHPAQLMEFPVDEEESTVALQVDEIRAAATRPLSRPYICMGCLKLRDDTVVKVRTRLRFCRDCLAIANAIRDCYEAEARVERRRQLPWWERPLDWAQELLSGPLTYRQGLATGAILATGIIVALLGFVTVWRQVAGQ